MIERYTLPEMGRIWSDAHKYELWCRVEVLVLEAQARAGTVPAESVEPVRSAQSPTPEAVAAVEAVTDHDVIAFLTAWADNTEPRSAGGWGHFGMTSSAPLHPGPPASPSPWPAAGTAWSGPGRRSRSAPCPGRSAAPPTSTRPSRPRSCPRSCREPRTS